MRRPTIVQFNLSPTLGGAEVFTASFSRALAASGWSTRVIVDRHARFWNGLDFGAAQREPLGAAALPRASDIVVVHAPLPAPLLAALAGRFVVGLAHQAIYDGTRPAYYDRSAVLLAVSRHVMATLERHGLDRVHRTPLYGVAELARGESVQAPVAGGLFDPDARKPRDRVMAALERGRRALSTERVYRRRPGLTLGVVSRLAPLKQFPLLFDRLVPILARHSGVNLEIFGAAVGYKALSALRRALAPLGGRVRFWGLQRDVAAAYRAIDYLLTGLPEREALGLNAIEACFAGTPVLAVDAPPFSETMKDGVTGFLYADPREDAGADFERVLDGLESGKLRPDLGAAAIHLLPFSFDRFAGRIAAVMLDVEAMRQAAAVAGVPR
jgi:glycosyltransferase involved in cell wall biosynthesis